MKFIFLLAFISIFSTKSYNNEKNNKKKAEFNVHKEGAVILGSAAKMFNDTDDVENVLSSLLQIIGVFFRWILYVETSEDYVYTRSFNDPAKVELLAHSVYDLINNFNLSREDKDLILYKVREEILNLSFQHNLDLNNEIEFCEYAE